jgi:hypothetical protein
MAELIWTAPVSLYRLLRSTTGGMPGTVVNGIRVVCTGARLIAKPVVAIRAPASMTTPSFEKSVILSAIFIISFVAADSKKVVETRSYLATGSITLPEVKPCLSDLFYGDHDCTETM